MSGLAARVRQVGICWTGTCRQPALALINGWPVCGEHGGNLMDALAEAVKDVCWKTTQFGTTEDGDTLAYIVPKGAMHRLIGAAQAARIPAAFRNRRDVAETPATPRCHCGAYPVDPDHCLTLFDRDDTAVERHAVGACEGGAR